MEAKGISQEQAMKLINIVQRTGKLDINLKEFVSNSEKNLRTEINNIQKDTSICFINVLLMKYKSIKRIQKQKLTINSKILIKPLTIKKLILKIKLTI